MKIKIKDEYLKELADSHYTTGQYRALLLLWQGKPKTLTQIATELGITTRALQKPLQELFKDGHIEVDRIEGRNKFYRACVNRKPPEDNPDEGQLTFTEEN